MGKYIDIENSIFAVFSTSLWLSEAIKTVPNNFVGTQLGDEFIRVDILVNGRDLKSSSGFLMIDIFTSSNKGPKRSLEIADKLDLYLSGISKLNTVDNTTIQFFSSSLNKGRKDPDNLGLFMVTYSINFNFYGAN